MLLALRFLSGLDLVLFPLCLGFFYLIIRSRARRVTDPRIKKLYFRAYYFKVICVISYTMITEFYFKGGDTGLFYQATQDLRAAIAGDAGNFWPALTSQQLTRDSPLFPYFYYDNYGYDITYGYMLSAHNFLPPRFALLPSYLFANSYICINLFFGFFALGGCIRLFKTFYYFYPQYYRELATACLFLPGVAFWSSGLLKDPISFGCIGYILYAMVNFFYKKERYLSSIFLVTVCVYFLYSSKIYILLVLILSILVWFFTEFNKTVKDKTLRNVFTLLTFSAGIGVGLLILNYITSLEAARDFQLDTILTSSVSERDQYAVRDAADEGGSHFEINTSNMFLLVLGGITATFFRPFLWEVNTPIALLSAFESLLFFLITAYFIFKRGIREFFTLPFTDGKMMLCFVYALVFAVAVGVSTANFGALSRYKIPCMPFYLILLVLLYRKTNLPYPRFLSRLFDMAVPKQ